MKSIYRYIQLGVYIRGYQDKETQKFVREIAEVTEFYVTEDNEAEYNVIYRKDNLGNTYRNNPSKYLIDYLAGQGVVLPKELVDSDEVRKQKENNENLDQETKVESLEKTVEVTQEPVESSIGTPKEEVETLF